jgi:hypothetical protein
LASARSIEHRINHFQCLYDLQQETGGFTAFIPWSFQPAHTALGGRRWDEATAVEYLKVLAISRLYLSNFVNVQSSWVTQGLKVCQMGLRFGGNDVGSVMLEENVVRAAGRDQLHDGRRVAAHHTRCGIPSGATRYVVPAVFSELSLRRDQDFNFCTRRRVSAFNKRSDCSSSDAKPTKAGFCIQHAGRLPLVQNFHDRAFIALAIFLLKCLVSCRHCSLAREQASSNRSALCSIAGTVVKEPGSQPLKKVLVQCFCGESERGRRTTLLRLTPTGDSTSKTVIAGALPALFRENRFCRGQ